MYTYTAELSGFVREQLKLHCFASDKKIEYRENSLQRY